MCDVPVDRYPMQKAASKALTTLRSEGCLVLKTIKSRAIIDFVSSLPAKTCKTTTRDIFWKGFFKLVILTAKS